MPRPLPAAARGMRPSRLGLSRLGALRLGSSRLGSSRLGSSRLGASRLGSWRLGLSRALRLPLSWLPLALLAVSLLSLSASAQKAEDAIGVWLNPENGSNVEFYRCGAGLCGKIVKVSDGQVRDTNNPNPAMRQRPIIGLLILEGARQTGDNRWAGTLYNRENGKTYSGTVTVKSKDALELSGCVLAVLCKTVTWARVR